MEKSSHIFTIIKYQKKVLNFFFSVIFIDSVFRTGKNYDPLVFQKNIYVFKEKKIPKYIIDDIQISSDFNEKNSDQ